MKIKKNIFERAAHAMSGFAGSTPAFILSLGLIIFWLASGPIFDYSPTWQLIINSITSIVTFLMVFLIQRSQNKDSQAIHLKLNEIVACLNGASNRLIAAEYLAEKEIETLSKFYRRLSEMAEKDQDLSKSHSVEEAAQWHKSKLKN
jgi:low affinity Fe/Cu permease